MGWKKDGDAWVRHDGLFIKKADGKFWGFAKSGAPLTYGMGNSQSCVRRYVWKTVGMAKTRIDDHFSANAGGAAVRTRAAKKTKKKASKANRAKKILKVKKAKKNAKKAVKKVSGNGSVKIIMPDGEVHVSMPVQEYRRLRLAADKLDAIQSTILK